MQSFIINDWEMARDFWDNVKWRETIHGMGGNEYDVFKKILKILYRTENKVIPPLIRYIK